VSQVTIYLHPQIVPHVQQFHHNVQIVVVLQRAQHATLAIIWLARRLVNCKQVAVRLTLFKIKISLLFNLYK
jgi:hypothetical protein